MSHTRKKQFKSERWAPYMRDTASLPLIPKKLSRDKSLVKRKKIISPNMTPNFFTHARDYSSRWCTKVDDLENSNHSLERNSNKRFFKHLNSLNIDRNTETSNPDISSLVSWFVIARKRAINKTKASNTLRDKIKAIDQCLNVLKAGMTQFIHTAYSETDDKARFLEQFLSFCSKVWSIQKDAMKGRRHNVEEILGRQKELIDQLHHVYTNNQTPHFEI